MKLFIQSFFNRLIEGKGSKKIRDIIKRHKIVGFILIIGVIVIDSLFFDISSDFVIFGTLMIYGIFVHIIQIKSKITFFFCLGLLTAMFISFIFSQASNPTEKLSVWLFLFLIIGIIQKWRE